MKILHYYTPVKHSLSIGTFLKEERSRDLKNAIITIDTSWYIIYFILTK